MDGVEKKLAGMLVVSPEKALNGIPSLFCERQMVESSSLSNVVATLTNDWQTEHDLPRRGLFGRDISSQ